MATDQQEERIGGHPADTGRARGTIRGALMVVGTMQVARTFAKQMGMADLEWRQEGEHVQRAEFTEWPHSQQLEQAIAASAAREWVTEKATRTKWRFDVPRKRPSQEHHRWPPVYAARPSMVPQRGAVGSSSKVHAWEHPLPQTVRSSAASQEELRQLIKKEVASLLAPYERLLEETKTAAKTAIAGKDAEIASLKQELAAVKAQARSSAVPAADPMSPPDLNGPPGTNEWRQTLRIPKAEPGSQRYSAQVQGHSAAPGSNGRRVHPPTRRDPGTSAAVEGDAAAAEGRRGAQPERAFKGEGAEPEP